MKSKPEYSPFRKRRTLHRNHQVAEEGVLRGMLPPEKESFFIICAVVVAKKFES